jgi:Na+/H+ antiporter NhaD/arsenite permease-like protein
MLLHPAMAQAHLVGTLIFCASYLVFAFGHIPGTKIDRTAMSVIGATLMVLLGVLAPRQALDAIDFPTLVLLFGMMLLAAGLEQAGFFERLTEHVIAHVDVKYLLPAVLFSGGILSALLVNDVVCVIMTPLVLNVAHRMRRQALPYLLALATASNIGSTATIVGNPQNILIASVSHIAYLDFLRHLGPIAVLGLFVDWAVLQLLFGKTLQEETGTPRNSLQDMVVAKPLDRPSGGRRMHWPLLVCLLVLVALLLGVNPAVSAAGAACLLLISRKVEPRNLLARVDLALLVFFIGLFIVLAGGEAAGFNEKLLALAEHLNLRNTLIFTAIITLLSNLVSNVPAVMLLKPVVVQQGNAHAAWLLLAMASTLAGNLTITGSVANIIVVESARKESPVSFWQYLRVGIPVTVITLAIGWVWLHFWGS